VVDVESDHESDETNSRNPVPAIKPQHYVATDINKLRNRWRDLLLEKRVKDSLERQLWKKKMTWCYRHHQSQAENR
jgi:hypothetical protein